MTSQYPGFFLYKERDTNKLQVIDGQQRILSAVRYFKNDFDDKSFRLKNVHPKWNGKKYEDLDEADRFQLDDAVLRATVVQQLDPDDDSSVFHIFERLNTGGINLNPMEIRKCVYNGPQFSLLEDLNSLEDWRKLIGQPKQDKRFRDMELVLRVVALSHSWESYKKPMKGYLNLYLSDVKKMKDGGREEFIRATRERITNVFRYALESLGEKPFHLFGRLIYAAMDSTLVAANKALQNGVTNLRERYAALIEDDEYIEWVTKDTSDEKILTNRIRKALSILAG
ncbi:MAG: GmrSD restriction endonuclease domain-containing protein [Acidobacteriaceae bacterium]